MAVTLAAAMLLGGIPVFDRPAAAQPASPPVSGTHVLITDNGFEPDDVTVLAGETVHWTNVSGYEQQVYVPGGVLDSGPIPVGGAYSATIPVPGTHAYDNMRVTGGALPPDGLESGVVHVLAGTLDGPLAGAALDHLPSQPPAAPAADDIGLHPKLAVNASRTRIIVGFHGDATVADANAALQAAEVAILGGLPRLGLLIAKAPYSDDFSELAASLGELRLHPAVEFASMSFENEVAVVPRPADTTVDGAPWTWEQEADRGGSGPNWWLEQPGFPQAWNLLEEIQRRDNKVTTGIIDGGFAAHPDLAIDVREQLCDASGRCLDTPNEKRLFGSSDDWAYLQEHGTHVAGTIGAKYDNPLHADATRSGGIAGANPVADMAGVSMAHFSTDDGFMQLFGGLLAEKARGGLPHLRVINWSARAVPNMAAWQAAHPEPTCGPGVADDDLPEIEAGTKAWCTIVNDDVWLREQAQRGMAARSVAERAAAADVMIVQSAGNEGGDFCVPFGQAACSFVPIPAESVAQFAWASRIWRSGTNPIVIVEAYDQATDTPLFSNLGGDISAPGVGIGSTVPNADFAVMQGTSMAAPVISGLIGYLLAFDPSLDPDQIRTRLRQWGSPSLPAALVNGARFDWRMVDRLNRDDDADGVVDVVADHDMAKTVSPAGWDVELDACASSLDGQVVGRYVWTLEGSTVERTDTCRVRHAFSTQGSHDVTLTIHGADGTTSTVTQQVEVRDVLIVSIGDSVASGEGVPDVPGMYRFEDPRWQDQRCHRSARSGPAQTARWLEAVDPKTSVTFVHAACSGARIVADNPLDPADVSGGLLSPYEGVEPATPALPPQVDWVDGVRGSRDLDALLVSIGANDMRFADILAACAAGAECHENDGLDIFADRHPRLERRYQTLDKVLREKGLHEDVVITEYFDPTYAESAGPPDMSCFVLPGQLISADEAAWASDTVVASLNTSVAEAAHAYGWDYRAGIAWHFRGHGYCADDPWVVGFFESKWNQTDKYGTVHPNEAGHDVYTGHLLAGVRPKLPVTVRSAPAPADVTPRIDAYATVLSLPGAAKALVDVNDPSPDGNRRIVRTRDAVGAIVETADTEQSTEQGYRTEPDGLVDMRDFRRFRDAWLASCQLDPSRDTACQNLGVSAATVLLDGDDDHPKKDLNFDQCVNLADPSACQTPQTMFSRFDFNGDGWVNVTDRRVVPLTATGELAQDRSTAIGMDDLEVLGSQFADPNIAKETRLERLRELMRSADLEIHAAALFANEPTAAEAELTITDLATNTQTTRTLQRADDGAIVTVPLGDAVTAGYEIRARIDGTPTRSVPVELDGLKYGEDRRVDLCAPHLSLHSEPAGDIPADGATLARIVATIDVCDAAAADLDVDGQTVEFSLEADNAGDATLDPASAVTGVDGSADTWLQPSSIADHYTVTATVELADGSELRGELDLRTIAETTVSYVWRQEVLEWTQEGTTRWPEPLEASMPDCTVQGVVDDHCVDSYRTEYLDDEDTPSYGFRREGRIVGVGDRLELTEQVVDSLNWSQTTVTLSDPDGSNPRGKKLLSRFGVIAPSSGGTEYVEHPLPKSSQLEDIPGGVLLRGLREVGELGYQHSLVAAGLCPDDPALDCTSEEVDEVGQVMTDMLLVPRGDGSALTFADDLDAAVPFQRQPDGSFEPYQYCGTFERDLTTEPGYRVAEPSTWIEGATSLERDPVYDPGDRPMPVGPGKIVLRYSFGAVAHQGGGTTPTPELPDCGSWQPPEPEAAFTYAPETPGEGRLVAFTPDPFASINVTEFAWDLGDGTTSTEREPIHTYDDNGTYTATLTVTDVEGRTASVSHDVTVDNLAPEASIDSTTGTAGRPVNVRFRMWDPGEADEAALAWSITVPGSGVTASGTNEAGRYYAQLGALPEGTHQLLLTVTDKDGEASTSTATLVMLPDDGSGEGPTGDDEDKQDDGRGVTGPSCGSLDEQECAFFTALNNYRIENNLPVLILSDELSVAADGHAADMAANDYFDHIGPDGSTPLDRARAAGYDAGVGENIYFGSPLAVDAMVGWKTSNPHNDNMLTPAWQVTGIARVQGGENGWTWVNMFGDDVDGATAEEPAPGAVPDTEAGMFGTAEPEPLPEEPAVSEPDTAEAPLTSEPDTAEEPAVSEPDTTEAPAPTDEGDTAGGDVTQAGAFTAAMAGAASADDVTGPAPVAALTLEALTGGFGQAFTMHNRSMAASSEPLDAVVDWGDGSEPQTVAAGDSLDHTFVGGGTYTVRLNTTDASGRASSVERRVTTALAAPSLQWTGDVEGSTGGQTRLAARLAHPTSGAPLVGKPVTLRLGHHEHTDTTDEDGRVETTIEVDLERGIHEVEALFGGDEHWNPALAQRPFEVLDNTAPQADPGGPYVLVAGDALSLDGSRSSDPDPAPDRIVTYEWDLDGDGIHGEVTGATPIVVWPQVEELMCGGDCSDGDYTIGLRVTDTFGAQATATTTVSLTADFALFVSPEVQALAPGRVNSFTVSVVALAGFDDPVSLRVEGLPEGVAATFSPATVQPSGVSSMKLTASEDAETGEFDLTVIGEGGGLTRQSVGTVQVSFGLIPICYGAVAGTVRDADTGAPVPGVRIYTATTDADGRYAITQIPLGSDNSPRMVGYSTSHTDYWGATGYVEVRCGAVSDLDYTIVERRYAHITGTVVAGTADPGDPSTLEPTDVPIPGARVHWSGGSTTTDASGSYASDPMWLNHNNAPRSQIIKATAPNFWPASTSYTATADDERVFDFVLRPVCTARITSGYFLDKNTREPIVGGTASLYISYPDIGYSKSFSAKTDATGEYRFDVDVPVGVNNTAVTYYVYLSPPPGSPPGSHGATTTVKLTGCDDGVGPAEAYGHITLPPVTIVGHVEGTITDEETGEPIGGVQVCASRCMTTTSDGRYRIENNYIATWYDGVPGDVQRTIWVSTYRNGYWQSSGTVLIRRDETSTLDLQMLAVRTGAIVGTVRDAVTGAALPGARIHSATSSADGSYRLDGVSLGHRNAPVTHGYYATLNGYWPQYKTVRVAADGESTLDYELLKECATASVSGVVVNALTQEPIPGARVNGWPVDADGRFLLTDLRMQSGNQPWNYTLTATAPGFLSQSKVVKLFCGARITLDFGRPQTVFGAIAGTVTDGRTDEPLGGVFIGTGFGASTTTAPDGTYRFDDVPLGIDHADRDWEVTAMPDGYEAMSRTVTVRRDHESRLDFAFVSNLPPTATPGRVRTNQSTPVEILLGGEDPDGDDLTFSVVQPPSNGVLTGTAPDLVYTPDPGFFGEDRFTFRASDGVDDSAPAAVEITVDPVGYPPVLQPVDAVIVDEGDEVVVPITATDQDGDPLVLSVDGLPRFAAFVDHGDGTGSLTVAPGFEDSGAHGPLRAIASDSTDEVSDEFYVYVRDVNRAPTVSLAEAGPMDEGAELPLRATATDADGDELTYTWSVDAGTIVGDGARGLLTVDDGPTEVSVTVRVSDGDLAVTATRTVTVVNVAPTVDVGDDRTVHWGVPIAFDAVVTDPSAADRAAGPALTWQFGDGGGSTDARPTHTFADPGDYAVTVTATDKDGGVGGDEFTVGVESRRTTLIYTGDETAVFGFGVLSARLVDEVAMASASLAGHEVQFRIAGQVYRGLTDADGDVRIAEPVLAPVGRHRIVVRFAGDDHYLPSMTAADLEVGSSVGRVTGGGLEPTVGANSGFTVSSDANTVRGQLQFRAREAGVSLHVSRFSALGISPDRTRAWFAGTARDGGEVVVHVVDAGEPGTRDRFRLWLDGRLLTGNGQLRRGNVQVHR